MQLLGVTYKGEDVVSSRSMQIGWNEKATNGYDSACDVMAAMDAPLPPEAQDDDPLPAKAASIIGYDNTARRLVKDIRPYGKACAWFVEMELNDTDTSASLAWSNYVVLPTSSVASGLTVTQVSADQNGTYQPIGAGVDMTKASSISLTEQEIERLPRNSRGYRTAVFRISMGQPDTALAISLKQGWNLVSFPMKPTDIDGLDWDNVRVRVYEYIPGEDGKGEYETRTATSELKACTGYWIHVPGDTAITVYGAVSTDSIKLAAGWNLIGVPHDIADFKATYSELWTPKNQIVDPDSILTYADGGYKNIGLGGAYSMAVTKGYWVFANASAELDMTIASVTTTPSAAEETPAEEEGDDGGGE